MSDSTEISTQGTRYIVLPWQQHAARRGDVLIRRVFPNGWDADGWQVVTCTAPGHWADTGLGVFAAHEQAEDAARMRLGAEV